MTKPNEPASPGMNESAPGTPAGSELTRAGSGFDLEDTRRELIALRVKHGAESPIGYRCSNIDQLLKQPVPPIDLIQRQMAELQRLLKR